MSFFAKFKEQLSAGMKKASGRTDFLEAVCAAAALTAFADGEASKAELEVMVKTVTSNPTLTGAFKSSQIDKTIETMLKRAEAGRTGRMGLYKEIQDIAADATMAETVYLVAFDVAEGEGGVSPAERKVMNEIAKTLGINPSKYENI